MTNPNLSIPLLLFFRLKSDNSGDGEGCLLLDFPGNQLPLSPMVNIPKAEIASGPALILAAATQGLQQAYEAYKVQKETKAEGTFMMPGGAKA